MIDSRTYDVSDGRNIDLAFTKERLEKWQREQKRIEFLDKVIERVGREEYAGTVANLCREIDKDVAPTTAGRWLFRSRDYLASRGIWYSSDRVSTERIIYLSKNDV